VDAKRFKPDARARASVRGELGIPPSALVFVFVGRLKHDKGVLELASAFEEIARARDDLFLLFVGPDEEGLAPQIRTRCAEAGPHLRLIGWTDRPERYIAASDIFCLPSHREGFGSVIIEAAAAGLPAIGSRINGIVDAIEDGIGGLLYPARDEPALARAMQNLANEEGRRKALGAAARARALRDFAKESLTSELLVFYERILQSTKRETQQERLRSRFD
jgi:glycosyltransferase involved in cell wall biosynthesis